MTETTDRIYESFLARQLREGLALSSESDLVELMPLGDEAVARYLVRFRCKGFVRSDSSVEIADCFDVGIRFPSDYLRRAEPMEVLTWLGPRNAFHPNISNRFPVICIGRLAPGTSLVDIVYQVFEVISWQKVKMREDDALNREACAWARHHADRYPVDRRPLKRRTLTAVTVSEDGGRV